VRARARRILLGRPIRYSDAGVWLAGQGVAHRAPALLSSFKYGPGQPALPSIYPSPPPPPPSHDSRALSPSACGGSMATANGSSKGSFEVPKVEVRFTKLFIDGKFVDAVSGTYTSVSAPVPSRPRRPIDGAFCS
jgi:hypothetical protein